MRQCTACNETKDEIEYRSKKHRRCIHCSYCDVCETVIQRGNKCILCNKTCNLCDEVKPRHQFNNKKDKKCIDCTGICIICKITLTDNKTSDKDICNNCINKRNRTYQETKKILIPEKLCIDCGIIKPIKFYISANHRKCKECVLKNTKKITKEDYDLLHPDEERKCIDCKNVKPNNEFKFHTYNYRNQCIKCMNGRTSYNRFILNKKNKVTIQEFTKEEFNTFIKNLVKEDCFYCSKKSQSDDKNGVDRINSYYNYSEDNCVSCCSICNMMKKDMDVGSFIRKCCEIYDYNFKLIEDKKRLKYHKDIQLSNKTKSNFQNYERKAKGRNLEFLLIEKQFDFLVAQKCNYCGKNGVGVDRLDNNVGYIYENCVACCKYCNNMKRDLELEIFIKHVSKIVLYSKNNTDIHMKASSSRYHEIFDMKVKTIEVTEIIPDLQLTDYLLGFVDSTCSIGSSCGYLVIYIKLSFSVEILNYINKQLCYIFTVNNGTLALKENYKCKTFLKAYKKSICKQQQVKLALQILNEKDKRERNILCADLQEANTYSNIKYVFYDLSCEYVAGLFDAHGTIQFCNNYLVITVSHSTKDVLFSLSNIYEDCYITPTGMSIYAKKSQIYFLDSIVEFLKNKKQQVLKAISFLKDEVTDSRVIKLYKNCNVASFNNIVDIIKNYDPKTLLLYNKYKEIENFESLVKYDNLIYTAFSQISKLKPKLIFCETKEHHKKWIYYRNKTSSICFTGAVGRYLRILVIDETTKKYIGILSISSDTYKNSTRDSYIKSSNPEIDVKEYINFIGNISTCVPLQPFGSNCNGGKLLVKLAFSDEVFKFWLNKYSEPLLIITTLSINGKSILYDRLPQLKFIGFTKGNSSYHLPNELLDLASFLIKKLNIAVRRPGRLDRLSVILSHLRIDKEVLQHGMQKGIYFGWVFGSKLDPNYDISELKTVQQMTSEWYTRWCVNRMEKMKSDGRFSTQLSLYHKDSHQFSDVKNLKIL